MSRQSDLRMANKAISVPPSSLTSYVLPVTLATQTKRLEETDGHSNL